MAFIVLHESPRVQWLQRNNPKAFLLLSTIFCRACQTKENSNGMKFGEALIGDFASSGLSSESEYRTAKHWLVKLGFIVICETSRTIKKFTSGNITYNNRLVLKGTKVILTTSILKEYEELKEKITQRLNFDLTNKPLPNKPLPKKGAAIKPVMKFPGQNQIVARSNFRVNQKLEKKAEKSLSDNDRIAISSASTFTRQIEPSPRSDSRRNNSSIINHYLKEDTYKETTTTNAGAGVLFYDCLKEVPISDLEKAKLTKNFPKEAVELSVKFVTGPSFKVKQSMMGALFHFCKNPPSNPEPIVSENVKTAMDYISFLRENGFQNEANKSQEGLKENKLLILGGPTGWTTCSTKNKSPEMLIADLLDTKKAILHHKQKSQMKAIRI